MKIDLQRCYYQCLYIITILAVVKNIHEVKLQSTQ
jgi:hypothetical protein